MSKKIPHGWKEYALKDVALKTDRYSFTGGPFGSNLKAEDYTEDGVRIIQLQNIGDGRFLNNYKIFTSEEKANELFSCNIFPGDIILSKMGDPVARAAIIPNFHTRYLMASDGIRLSVNKECFDTKFVHDSINSISFRIQAETISTGTTRKRIGLTDLREITFFAPPLKEQQKIASIITAVDEVIESTQAQINKLKDLKSGMMQELLTKGIGHTEFKDSPVGRIPKAWKFVRFDEVVTKVGSGITPSGGSAVYTTTGVPFIRSQNVYQDGLRWDDVCFISEAQHQKMKNSQLKPKDVLLNITGASIGRCYYLPDQFGEGNVNQHVCIIRCEEALLQHIYLAHFINSDFGQKQIMNLQAGGNREGLNFQQIRAMELPLPPLDEQVEITKVILGVESKIKVISAKISSLVRLKKSLMQDLLTGKIRVGV